MIWAELCLWMLVGAMNFVNRKNNSADYWKIMYWLAYVSIMALIIDGVFDIL